MKKRKEEKENTGKRMKYLQRLLDLAPRQDAYVFPRAMGKSERRSSAHLFWWVLCFLLMKKVLKTKRKGNAQRNNPNQTPGEKNRQTSKYAQITSRISLNGSLNKPEGFLNMLQLRKPHHASIFLLLMAKESCKALLLMISRKAVRECNKQCSEYRTDTIRRATQASEILRNTSSTAVMQ